MLAISESGLQLYPLLSVVAGVTVAVHWLKASCVLDNPPLVMFVQILLVMQSWVQSLLCLFEESHC